MRLLLGGQTQNVQVFLSSGDDLKQLRNLVSKLVNEAVNVTLNKHDQPVRIEIGRWELSAPHRVAPGETVNSEFVARARASQLLLCLLHHDLGAGTREELEAALAEANVDVAVIWCVEDSEWPETSAGRWLREHKDDLFIDRAGPPDTSGPSAAIVRALLDVAFTALSQVQSEGLMHETR
jgi:hypothetical protein